MLYHTNTRGGPVVLAPLPGFSATFAPMSTAPGHVHSNDVGAQLDTAEALCAQRGRRLTPIRRKVLELLLREARSVKAYELLESMRAVHPGAAPPTVYRALDFLADEGLIHRLDAVNAWIACHDVGGAPHDLLMVCTGCGAVAEVSDPAMTRQLAERVGRTGFALATHEIEIRALCPACQKARGGGAHDDASELGQASHTH
jgi:Fur family zinc uptake transcriptional regulator